MEKTEDKELEWFKKNFSNVEINEKFCSTMWNRKVVHMVYILQSPNDEVLDYNLTNKIVKKNENYKLYSLDIGGHGPSSDEELKKINNLIIDLLYYLII